MVKKLIHYILIGVLLLATGCTRSSEEYAEEDYEKLFPFKGIDKPKLSYEDQVIQLGNPDARVPIQRWIFWGNSWQITTSLLDTP